MPPEVLEVNHHQTRQWKREHQRLESRLVGALGYSQRLEERLERVENERDAALWRLHQAQYEIKRLRAQLRAVKPLLEAA